MHVLIGRDAVHGHPFVLEGLRDDRREDLKKAATRRRAAMLVPIIALLAPVMLLFILAPIPRIVFGLH